MMKKQTKWTLVCLALAVVTLGVSLLISTEKGCASDKKPKYVFYFIGDGMGFNHILGTEQYNAAKAGKTEVERLNFTKFDVRNFVTNYSVSSLVTDSAAAGTALATGGKTANNHVGVDAEGNALRSLGDVASEQGYMVGIVSDVGINDATPAAFYGHAANRFEYPKLMNDLLASGVAFIAGATMYDVTIGPLDKRSDPIYTADYVDIVSKGGFVVETDVERAGKVEDKRVMLVVNDKENKNIPYTIDRPENFSHSLPNYTKTAIEYLSREAEDGFFLVVEAGKLDYAAHEQDAVATFYEVNELAASVELALEFARQHPDETLIVVTSDHETGGMALGWDYYQIRMNTLLEQKHSVLQTTYDIRKLRDEGKSAWSDYQNVLRKNFGLWSSVPVTAEEEQILKDDLYNIFLKRGPLVNGLYNKNESFSYKAIRILNKKASIDWTSIFHTGMYTPLFVEGVGEDRFMECRDQTEIPKTIAAIMGGELK